MSAFEDESCLCPEGYRYYYVECMNLVGREPGDRILESEVYQPDHGWVRDKDHEISDRIIGYDPYEEPGWKIGNLDIMEEIRTITRDEAIKRIEKLRL